MEIGQMIIQECERDEPEENEENKLEKHLNYYDFTTIPFFISILLENVLRFRKLPPPRHLLLWVNNNKKKTLQKTSF